MEELINYIVTGDIVTYSDMVVTLVRLILVMVVFETLGVIVGHISSIGR